MQVGGIELRVSKYHYKICESRYERGDDDDGVAGSKAFIGRVKLVATVEGEVCNTPSQSMI